MSEKHTPGPWVYDELTDEIVGANDDRRILQDTFMHPADAQLAATAPDLLEALRSALFWLEKPEEDRLDDAAFQMFCDWARETVARAEGGDEQ